MSMENPQPNELQTVNTKIVECKLLKSGVTNGRKWSLYLYKTEGGREVTGFEDSHPMLQNAHEAHKEVRFSVRYNAERKSWNIINPLTDRARQKSKEFSLADPEGEIIKMGSRISSLERAVREIAHVTGVNIEL